MQTKPDTRAPGGPAGTQGTLQAPTPAGKQEYPNIWSPVQQGPQEQTLSLSQPQSLLDNRGQQASLKEEPFQHGPVSQNHPVLPPPILPSDPREQSPLDTSPENNSLSQEYASLSKLRKCL